MAVTDSRDVAHVLARVHAHGSDCVRKPLLNMMWPMARTTSDPAPDEGNMQKELENLRKQLQLKSEALTQCETDLRRVVSDSAAEKQALFLEKEQVWLGKTCSRTSLPGP